MNKLTAAVAAVLLGTGLAGTAHASTAAAPGPAPSIAVEEAQLALTVSDAEGTWSRAVLLTCPAAAVPGHPDPAAACADLTRAGGDLDALPGDPHSCTREYEPVIAQVSGAYRGRPVAWSRTYPNACLLDAGTGSVFRF
ncbi:SSI family serine proteinase inhibitor [Streptomyces fulvorobeus]|uniref:Subtilase-type protease inhibitor n=1 Tax=Streptomyces fulvorobeus TaxID=284028 RepID=A0A7J0C7Y1_9ACTN|nr:SSI family serine proteinase inhibitor [Streptomyces fulvorobeus]NYE42250.1 hypothetical protein [Streptomyces fulvorobeus]GFM98635.1 subtilase-type protease inhibitor [Streptomyces fulvorobeus]